MKRIFTEEEKAEIIRLYTVENLTTRQAGDKFNVNNSEIAKFLRKNNVPIKKWIDYHRTIPIEREYEIIEMYTVQNLSMDAIAKKFNSKGGTIKRILKEHKITIKTNTEFLKTPLSEQDEKDIINDYINLKYPGNEVQKKYKIRQNRFYSILEKYGQKMRKPNDTREFHFTQEQLVKAIEIYEQFHSITTVAKYFRIQTETIKREFARLGIEINMSKLLKRNGFLEKWVVLYGKEKGEDMYKKFLQKQSANSSGKNNPMYGKPSPQGSGNGYKGWYKNVHFRSLREVCYMIHLDENNIPWISIEKKEFTIPYIFKGKDGIYEDGTYRPDFLVEGVSVVEIKPIKMHNTPKVSAKKLAAEQWCKNKNLTFQIMDFPIDAKKIRAALDEKLIKFERDYEQRFLDYSEKHKSKTLPASTTIK